MKLHSYFRSSASYRVRIALELKGLSICLTLSPPEIEYKR